MEYIRAEEFLKQSKEVQAVFLNWWEPSVGDLFNFSEIDNQDCREVECICSVNRLKTISLTRTIPLLTEGQLRKFIEYKKQCKIDIQNCDDATYLYLYDLNNLEGMYLDEYSAATTDLLQAYWKVACEVAKEGISCE